MVRATLKILFTHMYGLRTDTRPQGTEWAQWASVPVTCIQSRVARVTDMGPPLDVRVYAKRHVPEVMEHSRGTVFVFLTVFQLLRTRIESEEQHKRYLCNYRRDRRLRSYRQQKVQHVMFHLFLLSTICGPLHSERSLWTKTRSSDWLELIVLEGFQEDDSQEKFFK